MVEVDQTITYLEMAEPSQLRPPAAPSEVALVPVAGRDHLVRSAPRCRGAWLRGCVFLTEIVRPAWRLLEDSGAVWLRTSSWDHPRALPSCLARGFEIVRRERHRQRPDAAHREVTPVDAMPRWWVRPAVAVDAEAVAQLLEVLGYALSVTTVTQRLAEHAASPEGMVAVAVRDDDQVLGVVSGRVVALFAEPATGFVRITSLSVSPAGRRSGIGQALVEFIELTARRRGLDLLEVSSGRRPERDAAHRFYASLGFVDTSPMSIRYAKSLDP